MGTIPISIWNTALSKTSFGNGACANHTLSSAARKHCSFRMSGVGR